MIKTINPKAVFIHEDHEEKLRKTTHDEEFPMHYFDDGDNLLTPRNSSCPFVPFVDRLLFVGLITTVAYSHRYPLLNTALMRLYSQLTSPFCCN
jgi:hypothetical protein